MFDLNWRIKHLIVLASWLPSEDIQLEHLGIIFLFLISDDMRRFFTLYTLLIRTFYFPCYIILFIITLIVFFTLPLATGLIGSGYLHLFFFIPILIFFIPKIFTY